MGTAERGRRVDTQEARLEHADPITETLGLVEIVRAEDNRAAISAELGPDAAAREAERAERVRDAIGRLSPKLAQIVVLRYPEGLSYEEIEEILGLPAGTVKSRLNRAHAALRELLGEWLDET